MTDDSEARYALCCSLPGCREIAAVEVLLYTLYYDGGDGPYAVRLDQDFTCPYLCARHMRENELRCTKPDKPERPFRGNKTAAQHEEDDEDGELPFIDIADLAARPRVRVPAGLQRHAHGHYEYPYTNQQHAAGFSVYRPMEY